MRRRTGTATAGIGTEAASAASALGRLAAAVAPISLAAASVPARLAALAALACAALALLPATAAAKTRQIDLGLAEPRLVHTGEFDRGELFDRVAASGAGTVRINAFWREAAPTRPAHPRDPADPAYELDDLDAAVRAATARGLRVVLTLQRSPDWAETAPNDEDRGVYKPDVGAFADYAAALARRYSGRYPDPERPGRSLPRVRYWQAWNEGNLVTFLAPQVERGKRVAVDRFRRLVNHAYREIKAAHRSNVVIAGGSAPIGPNTKRATSPPNFWRALFCLDRHRRALRCPHRLRFDVFDHHPISTGGAGPAERIPGWITARNYRRLRKILRAAERQGTVRPAGLHRPMWASEVYWESNPPDPNSTVSLRRSAHYLEQAIYLLQKQGVSLIVNFFLVDMPLDTPPSLQAGLYFRDGTAKPALRAFRFPLVTDSRGRRRAAVWGRAPAAGRVVIQRKRRRHGGWRRLASRRVSAGQSFRLRLRLRDGARVRARIGAEHSLPWRHRR